ncbi:GntR family transcriptional regulator [Microlunatus soli]|uniref:DNA-binding transcriptional regulator YhcF, GntR family n=1 Tax=Microlunatus soli TaxID=630515 RepID=A0A1H1PZ34_9ACTN|nr:GntR family transcriptional regulator [Microlunatus soli]SDS16482.1 DNA-binding transcriptional regulator YhcF, GntR family [Microlunatus soli]
MLLIDSQSPVPPFVQLKEQLRAQIRAGELAPGTRLPTVRKLASDLAIAPNTVARAYRELEAEKLIITRGRHGTQVADATPDDPDAAATASWFAQRMRRLGVTPSEAVRLVNEAFGADDHPATDSST